MNKAGGIGIAIVIIGAIIGVVYSMSSNTSEDNLPVVEDIILNESISVEDIILDESISVEDIILDESISVEDIILNESISLEEEIVSEESEQTSTDHTIELEENMGFKTP